MHSWKAGLALAALIVFSLIPLRLPARAQEAPAHPAIDMMVVIDNSCSMFPRDQILRGCTSWGSDIDFLRIKGANLFFARLGFAEPNEDEYQLGAISLGDEPQLVSPLRPVKEARDALARAAANPSPQAATRIVPALELAYKQLSQARHRPGNLPTVVLITDGAPWPPEGQSEADLEKLIQDHAGIPLFLMLLHGSGEAVQDYDQYVRFWEQMQARYNHVFVYSIQDAAQIEQTYNAILAQLQGTVATQGALLAQNTVLPFYVSEFVQKVVVTVVHPSGEERGTVSLEDPNARPVEDGEPGVAHYAGVDNPVEIFTISAPRLDDYLKQNFWKVKSSQPVTVFIDREGAYQVRFLSPAGEATEVSSVYQASEILNPRQEFRLRFDLELEDGQAVREAQPIRIQVVAPDGAQHSLEEAGYLKPDSSGVYEIGYDFAGADPSVLQQVGRFTFLLQAGSAGDQAAEPLPVASARLLVEVGPVPYIQSMQPQPIQCAPGSDSHFSLAVGEVSAAKVGSLQASVSNGETSASLEETSPGTLSGDLSGLCAPLLARLDCSSQAEAAFEISLEAGLASGEALPAIRRSLPVQVFAPKCTPRPIPAATSLPAATPTPPSSLDSDQDGLDDAQDACPQVKGWKAFKGCPPPGWLSLIAGVLGLGGAGLAVFAGLPWLRVRTGKPPEGYVLVCRYGKPVSAAHSVQEAGLRRRSRQVLIGSDSRKAHVVIDGLKPLEFVVVQKDERVLLLDARSGTLRGTFRHLAPQSIPTSIPEITLWIGLNPNIMMKAACEEEGEEG